MTILDVKPEWVAAGRYTAAADVDVNLCNSSTAFNARWTTTADNSDPQIAVSQGNPLPKDSDKAMSLPNGARLWVASVSGEGDFIGVEVMP